MEPEEDRLSDFLGAEPSQPNAFFNHLLDDVNSERVMFPTGLIDSSKEGPLQEPQEPQGELFGEFSLRSMEVSVSDTQKQDFHSFLLEKSSPQHPEQVPLEEMILSKKSVEESSLLPTKTSQINKTAYLLQTRADKITRYKEKKKRRVWHRKISYDCRKQVADKRERKNGRFVKKDEAAGQASEAKRSWQTRQGQPKQQCSAFKIQDFYS